MKAHVLRLRSHETRPEWEGKITALVARLYTSCGAPERRFRGQCQLKVCVSEKLQERVARSEGLEYKEGTEIAGGQKGERAFLRYNPTREQEMSCLHFHPDRNGSQESRC